MPKYSFKSTIPADFRSNSAMPECDHGQIRLLNTIAMNCKQKKSIISFLNTVFSFSRSVTTITIAL
jgi:hypothetical protein